MNKLSVYKLKLAEHQQKIEKYQQKINKYIGGALTDEQKEKIKEKVYMILFGTNNNSYEYIYNGIKYTISLEININKYNKTNINEIDEIYIYINYIDYIDNIKQINNNNEIFYQNNYENNYKFPKFLLSILNLYIFNHTDADTINAINNNITCDLKINIYNDYKKNKENYENIRRIMNKILNIRLDRYSN